MGCKTREIKDALNDAKEELLWWQGYASELEEAIKVIQDLRSDSQGVAGYHLNGNIATWDEVLEDSMFSVIEDIMMSKKEADKKRQAHHTEELRHVLYIKHYEYLPCTVQYTPVYGGEKYEKVDI